MAGIMGVIILVAMVTVLCVAGGVPGSGYITRDRKNNSSCVPQACKYTLIYKLPYIPDILIIAHVSNDARQKTVQLKRFVQKRDPTIY